MAARSAASAACDKVRAVRPVETSVTTSKSDATLAASVGQMLRVCGGTWSTLGNTTGTHRAGAITTGPISSTASA
eukprot:6447536-Prymnesium_polylepis.1